MVIQNYITIREHRFQSKIITRDKEVYFITINEDDTKILGIILIPQVQLFRCMMQKQKKQVETGKPQIKVRDLSTPF